MTRDCFISIEGGKITNRTAFQKFLNQHGDGRYYLKTESKNKRTNNQNRYIHGVLFPELGRALKNVGYSYADEVVAKSFAKRQFLTFKLVNHDTGEAVEYIKDTHELSTTEMNEFIESVIRFAAEYLNYEIPYPNEQVRIDM